MIPRRAERETVDGVPAELADPAHELWSGEVSGWLAYMERHGYRLPPAARLDGEPVEVAAVCRRRAAVEGWAVGAGVVSRPGLPDWHRLKALGLL